MAAPPRVLVVDDEESVAVTLGGVLARAGYRPETARSIDEARTKLAGERFDAAIVDLMVGAQDGLDLLKHLQDVSPGTVAIILTGYANLESAARAVRLGAFDYLLKPCDLTELTTSLARGLKARLDEAERVRAEVEAERHRLQSLFLQAPAIVAVSRGPAHVLELVNSELLRVVGRASSEELLGRPLREALPELASQGYVELLDQVYATGRPFSATEMPAQFGGPAGDPAEGFFNFVVQAYRDAEGRVEGLLVHAVEVTELVQARRQAEQLAAENARLYREARAATALRDEFLSVAAHELKTPLTSLRGVSQLERQRIVKLGAVDPDKVAAAFQRIDAQLAKLADLVNKLLDVTRIESGRLILEPTRFDLVPVVRGVVAAVEARDLGHPITVTTPDAIEIDGEPMRLEQVLANLLDNAIKYTPTGAPIEVEVRRAAPGRVELAMRDHGPGIPPLQRAAIFDRFFQAHRSAHQSGLGLGLYISKQIVELHRGTLTVEFPPDGGTRFVVRLPGQ